MDICTLQMSAGVRVESAFLLGSSYHMTPEGNILRNRQVKEKAESQKRKKKNLSNTLQQWKRTKIETGE